MNVSETVITAGTGTEAVTLNVKKYPCGDLSCTLTGGTRPHSGAVCLAYFSEGKAVVQTLEAPGHRDSRPAAQAARLLCEAFRVNVSVSAGLHIDHASGSQISSLCDNCLSAVREYIQKI